MFQDEARFGRMARIRRCWALAQERPTVCSGYEREFVSTGAQTASYLRPGVTLLELQKLARALTDVQAAEELTEARQALLRRAHTRRLKRPDSRWQAGLRTCGRCADAHRRGPWTT